MSVRSEKSLTTSRKVASISSYRPSSRSMGGDGGVSGSGCQRFEPAREGVKFGKAFHLCSYFVRRRRLPGVDTMVLTTERPIHRARALRSPCYSYIILSSGPRRAPSRAHQASQLAPRPPSPCQTHAIRPAKWPGPAGRRRATASRRQIILHRRTRGTCQRLQRWEALIRWICHRPCGSAPWHRRSGSALLTHRRTSWPSRQRAAGAPLAWMLLQGLGSCSKPTYPWLDMARTRGLPTARSCGGWRCAVAGASGSQSTSLACTFKVTSGSLCTARVAWVHGAPTRPPVCTLSAAR